MSAATQTLLKLTEYAVKYGPTIADAVKTAVDGFKADHPELMADEAFGESPRERIRDAVELLKEAKFRKNEGE